MGELAAWFIVVRLGDVGACIHAILRVLRVVDFYWIVGGGV